MTYQLRTSDASALICPGAAVTGDVVLGKGVSIWYNAVLRGDEGTITVGEDTNIGTVPSFTRPPPWAGAAPSATVPSSTAAPWGDNTLIGMGATVLNGARIGSNCIVGAGRWSPARWMLPTGP